MDSIIFEMSMIMSAAAILGTLFLYARQPILIAYIAAGFVVGPNGLGLLKDVGHIEQIGHVGVVLLLFIIGLNLQPNKLIGIFRKTAVLTLVSSGLFAAFTYVAARAMGFNGLAPLVFSGAMMFSSTVVGLKLVPTTALHQKRTGEIMTGVLLVQDIIAILLILFITGERGENAIHASVSLVLKLVLLGVSSFASVRFLVVPLFRRFDVVQEYTFVMTLGGCLFWAEVAHIAGLSYEMGAFIAGLSIASCPVAKVIAEHLKPLREFFLILFFFAIGAELNFDINPLIILAAVVFGIVLVPSKVFVFRWCFARSGETPKLSSELAVRLGQSSEFSLLLVAAAMTSGMITTQDATVIQLTTLATFVVSTYWTVMKYPTPISVDPALRRD